ncbi:hypothetical protein TNCV_2541391 [Trichonephila clavipes]|nr:hypothetical protein TNCV_2541391 [Trichonephila clavipes]
MQRFQQATTCFDIFCLVTRNDFSFGNEQNTENIIHVSLSSGEFVAEVEGNVCTASIMADKDILEFVQISKYIIDADSEDEKEIYNAAPVPTSSEMGNIMKNRHSYLNVHSNR